MNKTFLPFIMGQLRPVAISLLTALMLIGGSSFAWAQKTLPYSYGFEDNNLATDGWTQIDKISSSQIVASGSYGVPAAIVTDDYCFRFSSGYNKTEYIVSPLLSSPATGIKVSFYYINTSSYSTEQFQIGYSTATGEGEPKVSSFIWLEGVITPAASMSEKALYTTTINNSNIKYVVIKHISANSHNVFIDDITFESASPYKSPKKFVLFSFTSTSATFTWERGKDETAFEMQYIKQGDADSTTIEIGNVLTKTLNELSTDKEYKAKLRSNYGGGHYSEWTEEITFTPANEIVHTLFDGAATSYNLPISSANVDNSTDITQTQFIIPKDSLSYMKNQQITTLKFYASRASVTWGSATWEVYLKETDNTTYNTSTKTFDSWGTCVYNNAGLSTDSKGEMTIVLNTPFNYTGKNLMVGFKQKTKGTKPSSTYWYSINTSAATNRGIYHYGAYNGVISYLPKVTITSVPITNDPVQIGINGFTTYVSPRALDLTTANLPDGLTAYKAESVDGTTIHFTEVNSTVAANTGLLLAGTANTTYNIPVVGSGSDISGSNLFLVNSTGGTFSAESGYTYYGLKKPATSSDPLVFATFNPSTVAIPSNKAYLMVSNTEARQLTCVFDDEATGISATLMNSEERIVNSIYNLAGQRVAQPTKGLYIKNGRKVIVK